jgi:hypothetical protein
MKKNLKRIFIVIAVLLIALTGFIFFFPRNEVCCLCDWWINYVTKCTPEIVLSWVVFDSGGCYKKPMWHLWSTICKNVTLFEKDKPICSKVCSPNESLEDYRIDYPESLKYGYEIPCDNCE